MTTQDSTQHSSVISRLPFFGKRSNRGASASRKDSAEEGLQTSRKTPKWSFGVLNDPDTIEVPGEPLLENHSV